MEIWSVYDHPADHPRHCTVRKVLIEDDGLSAEDVELFQSVHEARSALARRGLTRVPRAQQDEPALLETWL